MSTAPVDRDLTATLASFAAETQANHLGPHDDHFKAAKIREMGDISAIRHDMTSRLLASGLQVEVQPPTVSGEIEFAASAACKARWPHRDSDRPIAWDLWESLYMPRVLETIRDGRLLMAVAEHDRIRVALGFVLWDAFDVLSMLFVKRPFYGAGIGLRLLESSNVSLPIKVAGETSCWRKWVRRHGIPTIRVDETDIQEWKRAKSDEERRVVLGVTGYDAPKDGSP